MQNINIIKIISTYIKPKIQFSLTELRFKTSKKIYNDMATKPQF